MLCYRRLPEIKALSFDLDDTLYDNGPIIRLAEHAQLAYLQKNVPEAHKTDVEFWRDNQHRFAKANPEQVHNLAELRLNAIYEGLSRRLGLPDKDAYVHAQAGFDAFHQQRTDIQISDEVRTLLEKLMGRYPLITLTNGTADIAKMGLEHVFEFALHAGRDGMRKKPAADMFIAATDKLGIAPANLLHIGDSLSFDVGGALNAGCSALWVNFDNKPLRADSPLPHGQVSTLSALEFLAA